MSELKSPSTKLLVSVANAAEALVAVENGAQLIDVKDPTRGSLGAASPAVCQAVLAAVGERVPVSAALGELQDLNVNSLATQTTGMRFAKVGLAGFANDANWEQRWVEWRRALPEKVNPVAVMYADWQTAAAIAPAHVMSKIVMQQRCRVVLIDTCDKSLGSLLQIWKGEELQRICQLIRDAGATLVLAGSLRLTNLPQVLPLHPDYVAVRGAVCRGSRAGQLTGALVREWADALSTSQK